MFSDKQCCLKLINCPERQDFVCTVCPAPEKEDSSMKLTAVIMGNLKKIPKRYQKVISIPLCGPGSNSF